MKKTHIRRIQFFFYLVHKLSYSDQYIELVKYFRGKQKRKKLHIQPKA
jgi:hypothetical protein